MKPLGHYWREISGLGWNPVISVPELDLSRLGLDHFGDKQNVWLFLFGQSTREVSFREFVCYHWLGDDRNEEAHLAIKRVWLKGFFFFGARIWTAGVRLFQGRNTMLGRFLFLRLQIRVFGWKPYPQTQVLGPCEFPPLGLAAQLTCLDLPFSGVMIL